MKNLNKTSFIWLEITERCQLACSHCYANSGVTLDHGSMTKGDWIGVIEDAAKCGVRNIQFIGGEPTMHPNLGAFVDRALSLEMKIEIFSNLANIKKEMWRTFARPGISLATSFYSNEAQQHDQITGRTGSFRRTFSAISKAINLEIPIRVGVIEVIPTQATAEAVATLKSLGVVDIGVDKKRKIGRGGGGVEPCAKELCGKCGEGRAAIAPNGDVWPCVFSRWLPVGNVRKQSLEEILSSETLARVRTSLNEDFEQHYGNRSSSDSPSCYPECNPACQPTCPPSCSPSCTPQHNCTPSGNCWPNYR